MTSETFVSISPKKPTYKSQNIELTEKYSKYKEEQVCRTCSHNDDRYWYHKILKLTNKLKDNDTLESSKCSPDTELLLSKVVQTTNWREQKVHIRTSTPHLTIALVSSCGQEILPKCRQCDRFQPEQVSIPYDTNGGKVFPKQELDGSFSFYGESGFPVKYWKHTVGGKCSIPVEGIKLGEQTVFCDPKPRKVNVENPSCSNCAFLDNTGDNWMSDHLEVNIHADLTKYEKFQLRKEAFETKVPYPILHSNALKAKTRQPQGRRVWFEAELLKKDYRKDQLTYKVRFLNGVIGVFVFDDDRFTVHEKDIPIGFDYTLPEYGEVKNRIAVEISWPHNQLFGLTLPNTFSPLLWPPLPPKLVEKDESLASRAVSNCGFCRPGKPCYYHIKAPTKAIDSSDVEFTDPSATFITVKETEQYFLDVVNKGDVYLVVDRDGNNVKAYSKDGPNASVFRLYLDVLLKKARSLGGQKAEQDVLDQFEDIKDSLMRSNKPYETSPSWLVPSSQEPSKSFCSHPFGLDLRKEYQDTFGSERTDWDFDTGLFNRLQVEGELYAGSREHDHTPQKLQEEILASSVGFPDSVLSNHSIDMGDTYILEILPGLGGLFDDDGNPIENIEDFYRILSQEVEISEGKFITKRQQVFGYDLTRGYYGSRKPSDMTSVTSQENEFALFAKKTIDEEKVNSSDWICHSCNESFNQSDIQNFFEPTCLNCSSPLWKNHKVQEVPSARASGGIGNAYLKPNSFMIQKELLDSTVCPNWVLSGSTNVTLESLKGFNSNPAKETKAKKSGLTIIKVGTLTEEQKATNDKYNKLLEQVFIDRQNYIEKYPETTQEELVQKFPTPDGIIYQIKAAGSLAKMGGS